MNSNHVSLSNLVSTALAQTKLTGLSDMLRAIAVTMDAYGVILWQAVPQADLDKDSLSGYLSVLADWFQNNERFALHNLPVRQSATGKAIGLGRSININDVRKDPTVYKDGPFLMRAHIKAMCTVPITFRDRTLGALNVYRNSAQAFSQADVSLIERLALLIPDLYQALLDRVAFGLMGQVNATIHKAELQPTNVRPTKTQIRKCLQSICDLISDSFQCFETSIFLEDRLENPDTFELIATTWRGPFSRKEYPRKFTGGLTAWVLRNARPVRILDLDYFDRDKDLILSQYKGIIWEDSLDFRRTGRPYLRVDGRVPPLSFIAAPIVKGKDVFGVVRCCAAKKGPYYFAERELTLLTYLSAQISRYWSNLLSLRSIQEENNSWQYLIEIVGQLNSLAHRELSRAEPDEHRIFREALQVTASVIRGAEVMDVRLLDDQTQELRFAETHGSFWTDGEESEIQHRLNRAFPISQKCAGTHVFKTGEVRMMPDVSKDPLYSATFEGIKAMIIAPIKIENKTFGVLDIRSTGAADFPRHAKSIAELLGQQLGVYHYLATTIRDLRKTQSELNQNIRELKAVHTQQTQIFENLKHQLYGPINHAHARIQSLLREEFPDIQSKLDEGTVSPFELAFLQIRGLFGRTRRVAKNTGFIADLARERALRLNPSTLRADPLTRELVNAANDNKLMIDPDKNITFRVDGESFRVLDRGQFVADYDLLQQAIMNIVDNAFKYSSHSTEVRIYGGLTGTGRFHISVSNEGTRIRSGEVARCVERGWRSEEARLTTGEGSGIGLWIVNHIINAHGGDLEIIPTTEGRTEIKLIFSA